MLVSLSSASAFLSACISSNERVILFFLSTLTNYQSDFYGTLAIATSVSVASIRANEFRYISDKVAESKIDIGDLSQSGFP